MIGYMKSEEHTIQKLNRDINNKCLICEFHSYSFVLEYKCEEKCDSRSKKVKYYLSDKKIRKPKF